jgi:hypothetical protein
MSHSDSVFDQWVGDFIALTQPRTVLDIGPGAGKYGRIVRERAPTAALAAREIDDSYVRKFALGEIYDYVLVGDAIKVINDPSFRSDMVIMGDVIEHMRKSIATDLLNFLVYRTSYIVILTPDKMPQDDWEGHAAEAHISTWSEHDFAGWKTHHQFKDRIHLFVVEGYQPHVPPPVLVSAA